MERLSSGQNFEQFWKPLSRKWYQFFARNTKILKIFKIFKPFLSQEEDINKKYEVDHAKHLPIIPEEGEENGRVPDTTVLQS